jgi:hypothetical protein
MKKAYPITLFNVERALETIRELKAAFDACAGTLSSAQQQMLMLGQAIVSQPRDDRTVAIELKAPTLAIPSYVRSRCTAAASTRANKLPFTSRSPTGLLPQQV